MLKRLMCCIREFKIPSVLSAVFVALEVVLECIIPFVMANLINQIQQGCSQIDILKSGLILFCLAILSLLMGAFSGMFCATASCGFARNLREDLFKKVQTFSFANIDKFSTASLVTRLTTDITNIQNAYMMIIRVAVRSPLMFLFSMIMAFAMNKRLSIVFVSVVPILIGGLLFIFFKAMPIFKRVFKKYDKLNNLVQENVKGMRVVKAYVREEYEKEKFDVAAQDVCKDFTKAEKILAFNSPIMQFAIYTVMLLVSFLGARTIILSGGTEMQVGQLSSLLVYGMQILMSLMMFSMIFVMVAMSVEAARRVVEVLEEEPNIKNPKNPIFVVENGDIQFENVSFKYYDKAEKMALNDINLKIKSGETIGILGGTGSGKTSLVQLLSRLYDVSLGSIKIGGVDIKEYDIEALRNEVSVVLQKNVLFSGTIKENLRWGDKQATDEDIVRVCKLAQADEFINTFPDRYDTYIEQGGTNVSGGQKQRLCIARALLKKPKILILDDSTSAVDTATDYLIRKAFREQLPQTTKIIIAQRISSIKDADKIVVMSSGKIDAIGTHEELLNNNKIYKEVYISQNKVGGNDE